MQAFIRFDFKDLKLDTGVQTVRFQGSIFVGAFVGAFHLPRKVSDENRAWSVSIRFVFQNYGAVCRKVMFTVFTRSDFLNQ